MAIKGRSDLKYVSVDNIEKNPENPRMIFDQEKLDILMESIAKNDILVPLIVYKEKNGKYILLDGERRWRCAKRLNKKKVPVNVISKPNKIENILTMFNIHNVREEWELMPTALKLGELMEELGIISERRLSELTSLNVGTIRRCKILLALPKKYQKAILNRVFKADFFIEMETKAIKKIEKNLPDLYNKYGREGLIKLFVDMQIKGKIISVTDFRLLQKIIQGEKIGLDYKTVKELIEKVIIEQKMNFREAYEQIEDQINVSNVEHKAARLSESFRSFKFQSLKKQERGKLKETLLELRRRINHILKNL